MTRAAAALSLSFGICLSVLPLSLSAQTPSGGPQRGPQGPPPPPKNLQVLPKDMSREDVIKVMVTFTNALGVGCNHCHIDDVPGRESDFASDEVPEKSTARAMMKMAADVNRTIAASLNKTDAVRVQCATCHRGVPKPKQLNEILTETSAATGSDAALAEYKELRAKYYGGQSYDFSEGNLVFYANQQIQANRPDVALVYLKLNLEYYPQSARTYVSIGNAYARKGDKDLAEKSYTKALAIDPANAAAKRMLNQLKNPAPTR